MSEPQNNHSVEDASSEAAPGNQHSTNLEDNTRFDQESSRMEREAQAYYTSNSHNLPTNAHEVDPIPSAVPESPAEGHKVDSLGSEHVPPGCMVSAVPPITFGQELEMEGAPSAATWTALTPRSFLCQEIYQPSFLPIAAPAFSSSHLNESTWDCTLAVTEFIPQRLEWMQTVGAQEYVFHRRIVGEKHGVIRSARTVVLDLRRFSGRYAVSDLDPSQAPKIVATVVVPAVAAALSGTLTKESLTAQKSLCALFEVAPQHWGNIHTTCMRLRHIYSDSYDVTRYVFRLAQLYVQLINMDVSGISRFDIRIGAPVDFVNVTSWGSIVDHIERDHRMVSDMNYIPWELDRDLNADAQIDIVNILMLCAGDGITIHHRIRPITFTPQAWPEIPGACFVLSGALRNPGSLATADNITADLVYLAGVQWCRRYSTTKMFDEMIQLSQILYWEKEGSGVPLFSQTPAPLLRLPASRMRCFILPPLLVSNTIVDIRLGVAPPDVYLMHAEGMLKALTLGYAVSLAKWWRVDGKMYTNVTSMDDCGHEFNTLSAAGGRPPIWEMAADMLKQLGYSGNSGKWLGTVGTRWDSKRYYREIAHSFGQRAFRIHSGEVAGILPKMFSGCPVDGWMHPIPIDTTLVEANQRVLLGNIAGKVNTTHLMTSLDELRDFCVYTYETIRDGSGVWVDADRALRLGNGFAWDLKYSAFGLRSGSKPRWGFTVPANLYHAASSKKHDRYELTWYIQKEAASMQELYMRSAADSYDAVMIKNGHTGLKVGKTIVPHRSWSPHPKTMFCGLEMGHYVGKNPPLKFALRAPSPGPQFPTQPHWPGGGYDGSGPGDGSFFTPGGHPPHGGSPSNYGGYYGGGGGQRGHPDDSFRGDNHHGAPGAGAHAGHGPVNHNLSQIFPRSYDRYECGDAPARPPAWDSRVSPPDMEVLLPGDPAKQARAHHGGIFMHDADLRRNNPHSATAPAWQDSKEDWRVAQLLDTPTPFGYEAVAAPTIEMQSHESRAQAPPNREFSNNANPSDRRYLRYGYGNRSVSSLNPELVPYARPEDYVGFTKGEPPSVELVQKYYGCNPDDPNSWSGDPKNSEPHIASVAASKIREQKEKDDAAAKISIGKKSYPVEINIRSAYGCKEQAQGHGRDNRFPRPPPDMDDGRNPPGLGRKVTPLNTVPSTSVRTGGNAAPTAQSSNQRTQSDLDLTIPGCNRLIPTPIEITLQSVESDESSHSEKKKPCVPSNRHIIKTVLPTTQLGVFARYAEIISSDDDDAPSTTDLRSVISSAPTADPTDDTAAESSALVVKPREHGVKVRRRCHRGKRPVVVGPVRSITASVTVKPSGQILCEVATPKATLQSTPVPAPKMINVVPKKSIDTVCPLRDASIQCRIVHQFYARRQGDPSATLNWLEELLQSQHLAWEDEKTLVKLIDAWLTTPAGCHIPNDSSVIFMEGRKLTLPEQDLYFSDLVEQVENGAALSEWKWPIVVYTAEQRKNIRALWEYQAPRMHLPIHRVFKAVFPQHQLFSEESRILIEMFVIRSRFKEVQRTQQLGAVFLENIDVLTDVVVACRKHDPTFSAALPIHGSCGLGVVWGDGATVTQVTERYPPVGDRHGKSAPCSNHVKSILIAGCCPCQLLRRYGGTYQQVSLNRNSVVGSDEHPRDACERMVPDVIHLEAWWTTLDPLSRARYIAECQPGAAGVEHFKALKPWVGLTSVNSAHSLRTRKIITSLVEEDLSGANCWVVIAEVINRLYGSMCLRKTDMPNRPVVGGSPVVFRIEMLTESLAPMICLAELLHNLSPTSDETEIIGTTVGISSLPIPIIWSIIEDGWLDIPLVDWHKDLKELFVKIRRTGTFRYIEDDSVLMLRKLLNLTIRVQGNGDVPGEIFRRIAQVTRKVNWGDDVMTLSGESAFTGYENKFMRHAVNIAGKVVEAAPRDVIVRTPIQYWSQRAVRVSGGASKTLKQVKVDDDRLAGADQPGKKVLVEYLTTEALDNILTITPCNRAFHFTKPEPGAKIRALFASMDEEAIIGGYASEGIEVYMQAQRGVFIKQSPGDVVEWMAVSEGGQAGPENNTPETMFLSTDYSDYNSEHTLYEMAAIDTAIVHVLMQCGHDGATIPRAAATAWKALSYRNTCVLFGGEVLRVHKDIIPSTGIVPLVNGLFSGHRDTARNNTWIHAIDVLIAKENHFLSEGHFLWEAICGDDEDICFTNGLQAGLYFSTLAAAGHALNPVKQMAGHDNHEFLQVIHSKTVRVEKPLFSILATLATGNWYVQKGLWVQTSMNGIITNYMECFRRGMRLQIARELASITLDRSMRVWGDADGNETDSGTCKNLEWYNYRCAASFPPLFQYAPDGDHDLPMYEAVAKPAKTWGCLATDDYVAQFAHMLDGLPAHAFKEFRETISGDTIGASLKVWQQKDGRQWCHKWWPKRENNGTVLIRKFPNWEICPRDEVCLFTLRFNAGAKRPPANEQTVCGLMGVHFSLAVKHGGLRNMLHLCSPDQLSRYRDFDLAHFPLTGDGYRCQVNIQAILSRMEYPLPRYHGTTKPTTPQRLIYIYAPNGAGKTLLSKRLPGVVDLDILWKKELGSTRSFVDVPHPESFFNPFMKAIEQLIPVAVGWGSVLMGQVDSNVVLVGSRKCGVSVQLYHYDPGRSTCNERLADRGWTTERIATAAQRAEQCELSRIKHGVESIPDMGMLQSIVFKAYHDRTRSRNEVEWDGKSIPARFVHAGSSAVTRHLELQHFEKTKQPVE